MCNIARNNIIKISSITRNNIIKMSSITKNNIIKMSSITRSSIARLCSTTCVVSDETQKRITVILKSVSADQKDGLRHICHEIQLKHPSTSQGLLLNEISQDQANSILVCSTPDVRQVMTPTVVTQLVPQTMTQTQPVAQTASVVLSNGQLILQLPEGFGIVSAAAAARLGNGLVVGREDGEEGGEEEEEEEAMDRSRSPSPQHHIFSGPIIK